MKKAMVLCVALVLMLSAVSVLATDAVSSASTVTELGMDRLADVVSGFGGLAMIATTDEDGTPRTAMFQVAQAGDSHLVVGLSPNSTRANVLREKKAVLSYYNAAAGEGEVAGARVLVSLEEDASVIATLAEGVADYNADLQLFLKIESMGSM